MCIVMQEDDTITQHADRLRRMASRWPSDYFLFPKLKEHLSGTEFPPDSDVKTACKKWLIEQGRDFYQAGLNKLVLSSDKCLKIFGDNVKK
uniref:Uncharacterized protein n=2 Tax=Araneus ventricosus TaxID=182803 RepID=A0A4Y2LVK7_ARAVE|nr:hypothetical protein AVEN_27647-1 [Araneus ventricosus]GBN18562.1 hypothetical protein AVEN_38415-1 [Araneus ventricosus]GBN18631.1 hypothetical protein AVEN_144502-1 [Araneus ventricosus]